MRVLFNFYQQSPVSKSLNVTVNGHAHQVPWPYPDKQGYMWRTYAVTIPITDLVPGTNVVQLGSDQAMATSNVNIVLVDVPGGVPVRPGSNNAYPSGGSTGNTGGGNTGGTAAAPTVSFSANPTNIASGKVSVMTWSSTNATSCTASGGWTGTKAISGTLAASPPTTTTYGLACTGSGGTSPAASATVVVNASQAPADGACGSANGTTASVKPSTALCAVGTASSVAGAGPWTWSCGGSNGGATASCSAPTGSASGGGSTPTNPPPGPVAGNCGLQLGGAVTFCDTFDTKNPGIPSRTGDLDPNVWGASRLSQIVNLGQRQYNSWPTTQLQTCNGTTKVGPPNDIIICNGQLRQASNDNPSGAYEAGWVTVLALYPKQPFDFSGRTGTVSFDVSNDTHGGHGAWPEFWMTNLPVPAPFNHSASPHLALPEHGFGVRFAASATAGQWGSCPNGNNLDKRRWTVESAVIVRNYIMDDTEFGGARTKMALKILDCVAAPPDNSGITNHVELKISQNQIDVYATDAGVTPSANTLKRIAVITDANLSFTRGLIWLQDVHYNADKAETGPSAPSQRQHTFVWDNVAFDGPFTYRDFSYDALDANRPNAAAQTVDLGKGSSPNQTASWDVLNIPANPKAASARVLFNFYQETASKTINVIVNGRAHPTPWPYPDTQQYTWRTMAVTIPITELVPGTNVVQIGADRDMVTSNVNIVLVDVAGGVPVLPGSKNAYPGGGAP